MQPFSH